MWEIRAVGNGGFTCGWRFSPALEQCHYRHCHYTTGWGADELLSLPLSLGILGERIDHLWRSSPVQLVRIGWTSELLLAKHRDQVALRVLQDQAVAILRAHSIAEGHDHAWSSSQHQLYFERLHVTARWHKQD
jgi:hypothetical protein